jgi:hypothetical protein
MDILFLNHKPSQCGVYDYGERLFSILSRSMSHKYTYHTVGSLADYVSLDKSPYRLIIYNYHSSTMPWLSRQHMDRSIKHIGIPHESPGTLFDYCFHIDPNVPNGLPRPLYTLANTCASTPGIQQFIDISTPDVPIIGSFGFGFTNKGFDKIVKYVSEQYQAAIIKLVIPYATYGDAHGGQAQHVARMCHAANKNPRVSIHITHQFFTQDDILLFLQSNTVNIFLYDKMNGRGISSTIDYALSVKTPIVISDSHMFRHIYSDKICAYKNSISAAAAQSTELLQPYREKWAVDNALQQINAMVDVVDIKMTG